MKAKERGSPRHDELRHVLKERRQRAGLTQRELAARLGWDHKTVSSLERGSKRLTVLELIDLAEALDFDAPALVRRLIRHAPE